MIINALNCVWSDTQILQIFIQQELQKLKKILQRDMIETFAKLKKTIQLTLAFSVMKTR